MLRVDFYIQQLMRHNALGIELTSNQPVVFSFPQGERRSNNPIEHRQVVTLLQEIAPPQVLQQLNQNKTAEFVYSQGSAEVQLKVHIEDPQTWRVKIIPLRKDGATQQPATPELESTPPLRVPSPSSIIPNATSPLTGEPVLTPRRPLVTPLSTAPGEGIPLQKSTPEPPDASIPSSPSISSPSLSSSALSSPVTDEPRINRYLRRMIQLGGSDLHLSSSVKPLVRLHGEMKALEDDRTLASEELSNILLEILPERNRAEFAEKHDTDFAHTIADLSRFRANYFVDRHGIGAVFRQIPFTILSPEALGLPKQVLDLCWLSKGLVVVTGPTGSGKSTTLATLIDYINVHRHDHIITIEDPIEFVHPNKNCLVNQREIGTHTMGFKSALRAALREDPDIVLVGEMRDLETIAIAIETAETGHLVFGTLHTTTAPSTVDRIIDQFPSDRQEQIRVMLSESLKGVIAQVLCKKKSGGRAAAYEVLIGNNAVSNLVREGKTFQLVSIMQTGKSQGMQTMNESLLTLVTSGQVDAKEAYIKAVDKHGLTSMFKQHGITLDLTT